MQATSGEQSDVLRIEISAQGEPPNGLAWLTRDERAKFSDSWPAWLWDRGPVIPAKILSTDGKRSFQGMAFIDTGGRSTFVELQIAEKLGLVKRGQNVDARLPGDRSHKCDIYDGMFQLADGQSVRWPLAGLPIAAPEAEIQMANTILIVGRDFLRYGRFDYDGENGRFTLSVKIPCAHSG